MAGIHLSGQQTNRKMLPKQVRGQEFYEGPMWDRGFCICFGRSPGRNFQFLEKVLLGHFIATGIAGRIQEVEISGGFGVRFSGLDLIFSKNRRSEISFVFDFVLTLFCLPKP